jgi:hypothetical protein
MRALLVSILLLFASACATQAPAPQAAKPAAPEYFAVASQGPESVRLSKAPCTSQPSLAAMPEEHRKNAMAAQYSNTARGVTVPACWVPLGDAIGVADAEGDAYVIPAQAFRPVGERPLAPGEKGV